MTGDTLVLRIEEYNEEAAVVMIRLFVFYDTEFDRYALRGNRFHYNGNDELLKETPFSYYCNDRGYVFDFIKEIFTEYDLLTVSLLNYPDLPMKSDLIQYPLLNDFSDVRNEIVCFDNGRESEKLALSSIYKHLKLIKVLYNNWNESNESW
jgi:hypothetical protein